MLFVLQGEHMSVESKIQISRQNSPERRPVLSPLKRKMVGEDPSLLDLDLPAENKLVFQSQENARPSTKRQQRALLINLARVSHQRPDDLRDLVLAVHICMQGIAAPERGEMASTSTMATTPEITCLLTVAGKELVRMEQDEDVFCLLTGEQVGEMLFRSWQEIRSPSQVAMSCKVMYRDAAREGQMHTVETGATLLSKADMNCLQGIAKRYRRLPLRFFLTGDSIPEGARARDDWPIDKPRLAAGDFVRQAFDRRGRLFKVSRVFSVGLSTTGVFHVRVDLEEQRRDGTVHFLGWQDPWTLIKTVK